MTDRLLIALAVGMIGWGGLFPPDPAPLTRHEQMVQKQHAKICTKKKLKAKTKALCRNWGYDR